MQCRVTIQQARAYLAKVSLVLDSMSSNPAMSEFSRGRPTGESGYSALMVRAVLLPGFRFFDGGNYPASVTAIDDATLLFVSKQDFQALCLAILM